MWLAVTQVCHIWRDVALNSPRLWTTIYIAPMKRRILRTFLARSKQLPLSIYSREATWLPPDDVMYDFLGATTRAQRLELELADRMYGYWYPRFPTSFPRLLDLSLYCPPEERASPTFPIFLWPQRCTLPCLTTLIIVDYAVNWKNLRLPETLKMLDVSTHLSEQRADVQAVLNVLERLPKLEELYLWAVLQQPAAPPKTLTTDITKATAWPRLHTFQLQETWSLACILLLSKVNLPGSAKVYLSFCEILPVDAVPSLVSCLLPITSAKAMAGEADDTVQAANWLEISPEYLHIYKRRPGPQLVSDSPDVDIHIKPSFASHDLLVFFQISKQLPLRDVEVLVIIGIEFPCSSDPTFAQEWRELLRLLDNVGTLKLVNYDAPIGSGALDVLCTETSSASSGEDSGTSHERGRLLLPKITTISLQNLNFKEEYDIDDFLFVSEVESALAARKRHSDEASKMELLSIHNCRNMDARHVKKMKKFVRPVDWDGKVKFNNVQDGDSEDGSEDDNSEDSAGTDE